MLLLLVLLLHLLIGSVPAWGYSRDWGYLPVGHDRSRSDHPGYHARARQILRRFEMSTPASIRWHPIHPMLIVFPIALWIFSLICDLIYHAGPHNMFLEGSRILHDGSQCDWRVVV